MDSWKSYLRADPTEWLLETNNPSVRYFTLRNLLEKPETNSDVKEAKQDIMRTGVVPAILEKQKTKDIGRNLNGFITRNTKAPSGNS